jgi:hypothetical protein
LYTLRARVGKLAGRRLTFRALERIVIGREHTLRLPRRAFSQSIVPLRLTASSNRLKVALRSRWSFIALFG